VSYCILLVDDSPVVRHMVRKVIEISGLDIGQIVEAANGSEALEAIEKNWIDVVVADINMPVMTGAEMVKQMVARDFMATTPVIIVSSEKSAKRMEELKQLGVKAYLNKPFRPEEIKQVIGDVLRERKEAGHD
jgi:two-component system chemotaxis response regulator CheY